MGAQVPDDVVRQLAQSIYVEVVQELAALVNGIVARLVETFEPLTLHKHIVIKTAA
jgi:hypothetical protein